MLGWAKDGDEDDAVLDLSLAMDNVIQSLKARLGACLLAGDQLAALAP